MTEPSTEAKEQRGFAEGELVVLRPVLEDDLAELARLMAENPYEDQPAPWTHQRLKKKFEDKDNPGLWEDKKKIYSVARKTDGAVVGFVREAAEKAGKFWCGLHVGEGVPDRDALGADLVQAYLAYKRRWHRPWRISFAVLMVEEQKRSWLEAAGFEEELVFDRAALYRGEPAALGYFSWIADWVLAARGERTVAPGEDNPRGRA